MSSLLYKYNPNFKCSEAELRKNHTEFMDSNIFQQQQPQQLHQQLHQQLQQPQQQSSGLMRYRSAPSSFLMDLVDSNGGVGCEDSRYLRPSSPEVETVLARFISSCNEPDHHDNSANSLQHQFAKSLETQKTQPQQYHKPLSESPIAMSGGPITQDWEPVVIRKKAPTAAAKKDEKAVNAARRSGAEIETLKKATAGTNKAASSSTTLNTRKLDEETENLAHERVPSELKKAIMQARMDKKLTQSQLAQIINEKPQVIQEYESGKAIPNQQVITKLERALGAKLRGKK